MRVLVPLGPICPVSWLCTEKCVVDVVCAVYYCPVLSLPLNESACHLKAAFHDTDTDILARILAKMLARMSVSMSMSWNAAFSAQNSADSAQSTDSSRLFLNKKEAEIVRHASRSMRY